MIFTLIRDSVVRPAGGEAFTPGEVFLNGLHFCYSCEDEDRRLEDEFQEKVYGRSAIPRGKYRLLNTFSHRFQRVLPILLDVSRFEGVRIHGANNAKDLLGCVGVGKVRTPDGIAQCKDTVNRVIDLIDAADDAGEECWLEIK